MVVDSSIVPKANSAYIIVYSPIYIIKSYTTCLKCGKEAEAWGLATNAIKDCEAVDSDVDIEAIEPLVGFFILSHIQSMPDCLLKEIKEKTKLMFPDEEKSYDLKYYANHCSCGEMFSDDDIFHSGGGALSPTDQFSCEGITIEQLPAEGEFKLDCSYMYSDVDLIWEYAERVNF